MALYEVPGVGNVEFPDDMPVDAVEKAIRESMPKQDDPSAAQGLAREAGIATRAAVNPVTTGAAIGAALASPTGVGIPAGAGAGALAGLLVELGADYYNKLIAPKLGTGKQILPSEALDELKDTVGLPKPETRIEKLSSGAIEGATMMAPQVATGTILAGAGGTAARVGQTLLESPALQTASYGLSSGLARATEDFGPIGSTMAGVAGAIAPSAPSIAKAGSQALLRGGVNPQEIASNIKLFRDAGIEPTIAQATGTRPAQAAEMLLSKTPGGAGVMEAKRALQQEGIGKRVDDMATLLGGESDIVTAGQQIKKGIKEDFVPKQRAIQTELYNKINDYVQPDTEIKLNNTWKTLTSINEQILSAPNLSKRLNNPFLEGLESDLRKDAYDGQLPYKALRALRTKIGDQLGTVEINPDVPRAQLKKLYAALSDDLRVAVDDAGPEARVAYEKANKFTKDLHDKMDVLQTVIDRQSPEQIFQAAISGTRDGYTRIRTVMNALPEDGKRALASAFIRRLGRSVPSQQNAAGDLFSTQTFIKNYSVLKPQTRDALFGKMGTFFRNDLDKIAATAERINTGSKVFENKSGTAQQAILYTTVGGVLGSLLAGNVKLAAIGGAGIGGANIGAKIMTSPRVVRWLASNLETPITAFPASINTLINEARKDDDIQAEEAALGIKSAVMSRELGR